MIVGTGIFNFKEKCLDCGAFTLVDINGFCSGCYIEDIEEDMDKFYDNQAESINSNEINSC